MLVLIEIRESMGRDALSASLRYPLSARMRRVRPFMTPNNVKKLPMIIANFALKPGRPLGK
jgi:hypothetical protein